MIPPPSEPPERRGYRPFPEAESFLFFLCMIVPGVTAAGLAMVPDFWSPSTAQEAQAGRIIGISMFVLLLLGCCAFSGWISAAAVSEDRRLKESIKSSLLMLLLQVALVPVVGLVSFAFMRSMF